jgi:hypothetical protein
MLLKIFRKIYRKLREERERKVVPEKDYVELNGRLESDREIPFTCYQGL